MVIIFITIGWYKYVLLFNDAAFLLIAYNLDISPSAGSKDKDMLNKVVYNSQWYFFLKVR